MPTTYARPELLVTTEWLADNGGRAGLRVLDCRWRVDNSGRRHHAEGHIPGSLYIDWAGELVHTADPLPFQLAEPEAFAGALVRAGVGDGMTVVLYDDTDSLYAARVWWSLRAYGLDDARVLDGGWPAWLEAGRPISTAASPVEPVAFTPRPVTKRLVTTDEMTALLGHRTAQILDARSPAEYHGQGGRGPRRGHIPGARNVPAALLKQEGSQAFPSGDALARLLRDHGVAAGRRSVTYDATGIGAAKLAFCLELMGQDDVALYDAGWADWVARPAEEYPIES